MYSEKVNDLEKKYDFKIPDNLKHLSSYQYWLLSHQITVFRQKFYLGISDIINKKDIQEFKYTKDHTYKYVKVNRELKENSFNDLLNWLSDYKTKWDLKDYSLASDVYKSFDEFILKDLSDENRIQVFKMICLLQNIPEQLNQSEVKIFG